jgi:hypothetical protein
MPPEALEFAKKEMTADPENNPKVRVVDFGNRAGHQ